MTGPGVAMAAEIAETPAVLARLGETASTWDDALRRSATGVHGVALTARGSSDHAAAYGRYLLEQALGVPAWSTAPSLITRYASSAREDNLLAIAVSQSGCTPEIVAVLEHARAHGARTVAVTNDVGSPLADAADVVVPLMAGREVAVPSTKTFTASIAAFAYIARATDTTGQFGFADEPLSHCVAELLDDSNGLDEAVGALVDAPAVIHLGRGYLLPLAREGALKFIEAVRFPNMAWSPVDFLHGPFAMVRPGTCVIIHHADGPVAPDTEAIARRLIEAGSIVISIGQPLTGTAVHIHAHSSTLGEHLQPVLHAVRVQQLALALALARDIDPDRPPGLDKVTATT
ncbi:MAG: SIS domain-containing protein [Ilumatobacteraceae bacterium]